MLWDLPYPTHKHCIEDLTDGPHLQSMLHSRYVSFITSLDRSQKLEVKFLYTVCKNNLLTVTGSNIKFIMSSYECKSIQEMFEKKCEIARHIVYPTKDEDKWRAPLLEDLVEMRDGRTTSDLTEEELEYMIDLISTE